MSDERISTGVTRLDELMRGGVQPHANFLVYGPPFVGKEVLLNLYAVQALEEGQPVIFVLTDGTPTDKAVELNEILEVNSEKKYSDFEKEGLVMYVDSYSRTIEAEDNHPNTVYVDGNVNLNAIGVAVNEAMQRLVGKGEFPRLVFDSISTLIIYSNAPATFRFLQVLAGRVSRNRSTAFYVLEKGMHTDTEVQMFKHLMRGVFEFQEDGEHLVMRVQGGGDVLTHDWVAYSYTPLSMDLTGSFTMSRVI